MGCKAGSYAAGFYKFSKVYSFLNSNSFLTAFFPSDYPLTFMFVRMPMYTL